MENSLHTDLIGRLVVMHCSNKWINAWTGFGGWERELEYIPKKRDGTPLPARVVAAFLIDGEVKIAVEMQQEPHVPPENVNRGGLVEEFWLRHVRLVPNEELP